MAAIALVIGGGVRLDSSAQAQNQRGIDSMRSRATKSASESGSSSANTAPSDFRVESFTPLGRAWPQDSITVLFTSDLPANLKPSELSGIVSFDPGLEADVSLESPRKIRLSPRRPLRPATTYKARLSPLLRDSQGQSLGGSTEFQFATDALDLTNISQADFGSNRSVSLSLTFNGPVSPTELRKFLSVNHAGLPIKYGLTPNQVASTFRVLLESIPTGAEHVSVRLQQGLRGTQGPRGLTQTLDRRVAVKFDLQAVEAEAKWQGDQPTLDVRFNASLSGDLSSLVKVSPPVKFHVSTDGSLLSLRGAFQPNQRYGIQLASGIRAENGAQLQNPAELSAFVPPIPPFLTLQDAGGYLSLQGRMKLRIRSQGLSSVRLRGWRVFDNNLPTYIAKGESDWEFTNYAKRVLSQDLPLTDGQITEVDLARELGSHGAGYYKIEASGMGPDGREVSTDYDYTLGRLRGKDETRIALTNLGIISKVGPTSIGVWVVSLHEAKPVEGAAVEVYSEKYQPIGQGRTDGTGFVLIQNPAFSRDQKPVLIQVVSQQDRSFLDLSRMVTRSGDSDLRKGRPFPALGYEAFVTPDRGAYRPGEAIRLFGMVRDQSGRAPAKTIPMNLRLTGPDGRMLPARNVNVEAGTGAFETTFSLTATAPTGLWRASLRLPIDRHKLWLEGRGDDDGEDNLEDSQEVMGGEDGDIRPEDIQQKLSLGKDEVGAADFFVEEFVPNRLKVTAEAPQGRLPGMEPIQIQVRAEEMFGASAGERPFEGRAILRPVPFEAAGYDEYVFGNDEREFTRREIQVEEATLSSSGQGTAKVALPMVAPPAALQATILMTVKDIGGRGVTQRLERVIDPVPYYLGAQRPSRGFLSVGQQASLALVAVRSNGKLATDVTEVSATVFRIRWNSLLKREDGRFSYEVTRELTAVETKSVPMNGGKGQFVLTPPTAGAYMLVADAPVDKDKLAPSVSLPFYASTGQWQDEAWSMEKPESLEVVADKGRYEVGETARVLIKAPFAGTLLLTLEQNGVLRHEVRIMASNTEELEIPVEDQHLPNVFVSASVVRPVRPAGRWLPHRAMGTGILRVNPVNRRLAVSPSTPVEVRPDTTVPISLLIQESSTSTPASQVPVTLWAVDEGILSLTNFQTPDPHGFYYGPRALGVRTSDYLGQLMPDIDPAKAQSVPGGGEAGTRGFVSPVATDRVKPFAIWLGRKVSGPDGRITADIPVPNFIGRLRLMAIAADAARFGSGEAELLVRNPVMIREGLPRFASPGDQLFVPVTAYNNTAEFATMGIRIATSGPVKPVPVGRWKEEQPGTIALETTATAGQSSTRLAEIQIARQTGVARFNIEATLGQDRYAESVNVPIRPASPPVRRSGVIEVAPGSSEDIPLGMSLMPGTARVHISAGSMPMLAFAPALLDLIRQPFGCSEQIAAGAFPLLQLADLAKAIDPGRFHQPGITSTVQQAVDRLTLFQTSDGGFAAWPGQSDAQPYNSVFVTHFLLEARNAGYEVPREAIHAAIGYCQNLFTDELPEESRPIIRAYAALILALSDAPDRAAMERLSDQLPTNGNEARAILASAFVRAKLAGRAKEILSQPAQTLPTRSSGGAYSSPIRETALLLSAWLDADPKAPDVAQLAKRLSSGVSKRGHFGTTQDNAFALFALGKLARVIGAEKPASGILKAAGMEPMSFSKEGPVSVLADHLAGTTPTVTVESGSGPAYVFYSIEGVPTVLGAEETTVSQGIQVSRRFLDRSGKPLVPRRLEQGSLIQVEVEFSGVGELENLALVDLLPAGFEIENPNLASSDADGSDGADSGGVLVHRTEVRDDRFLAFFDLTASDKPRRIRYSVRCVTAGTFALSPVQVVAMYDPDIVARSGAGVVSINPKRNVTPAALP
jgi:uncharacterized protein YfaS (alpha-2-macroglobulin family)